MRTSPLLLVCLLLSWLLQACSNTQTPVNYYDFGIATKPANNAPGCHCSPINLTNITASTSLDGNLMLYRLLYANDQQVHAYANHRWNMPPAQLLAEHIKTQLTNNGIQFTDNDANTSDTHQLRLALDDFSQNFTDAEHSYAQITLRASLIQDHKLLAQTTLHQQANADAANAIAGAQAMRRAADELIMNLNAWLCKQMQP